MKVSKSEDYFVVKCWFNQIVTYPQRIGTESTQPILNLIFYGSLREKTHLGRKKRKRRRSDPFLP